MFELMLSAIVSNLYLVGDSIQNCKVRFCGIDIAYLLGIEKSIMLIEAGGGELLSAEHQIPSHQGLLTIIFGKAGANLKVTKSTALELMVSIPLEWMHR
jgi:hypothetical protein